MALISGRSSALNPNAPLFIPAALHQVEDFSPQWWELVKTSTWFRDYWLSQHKEEYVGESAIDAAEGEIENMLPETFDMGIEEDLCDLENEFEQLVLLSEAWINGLNMFNMENKALLKDLMTPKSPKEKGPKSPIGPAKHLEKPPQYVNVKCAPRRIHQPR